MTATRVVDTDGQQAPPAAQQSPDTVHIRDVVFGYGRSAVVLRMPELRIPRAERVFLHGPSGSGKTTLLGLLTGVLQATSGTVDVLGQDLTRMSGSARDAFRGSHMGYIFQMFNLIPYLSVLDNIALPCRTSVERRKRLGATSIDAAAREMARHLGIDTLIHDDVTRLSVGQQQRVAAARALLGSPELIVDLQLISAERQTGRRVRPEGTRFRL